MADVIVYWGDNQWYSGNVTGNVAKGKPAKVYLPFLKSTEIFQPDELDNIKPAPFYLDGSFTTSEAKKIVGAANLFSLVKSTLDSSLKLGGYNVIYLTDGMILSRGDNRLEKTDRFARLEIRWNLKTGISMVAQIAARVGKPEEWGKILWTGRYKDTTPTKSKVLDLVNQFIGEQEK